jgi:hypothetical protein
MSGVSSKIPKTGTILATFRYFQNYLRGNSQRMPEKSTTVGIGKYQRSSL